MAIVAEHKKHTETTTVNFYYTEYNANIKPCSIFFNGT
jgi:hypothetical protein